MKKRYQIVIQFEQTEKQALEALEWISERSEKTTTLELRELSVGDLKYYTVVAYGRGEKE